ncbi:MAG TPA: acyl-CoA dehydrogenase C-terminal domain-containing protein, partial [Phenylobacterium sp.]|nr:acyl-CoA dehydrogenase C-terminal domain-containing protein [Phenylobacterium sp.]
ALAELRGRVEATAAAAERHLDLAPCAAALRTAWEALVGYAAAIATPLSPQALAGATSALRAFGHAVVSWLWLDIALAAKAAGDDAFLTGKIAACRFFFEQETPRVRLWLDLAAAGSDTATALDVEGF